jgi:hypothetical protein
MSRKFIARMALALSTAAGAQAAPSIVDAQHAYYQGRYDKSLQLFESLAARQDGEAAECAAFMLLQGHDLYGSKVRRDVDRARVLLLQAARAGRPGAIFMLNMLERSD